MWLNLHRENDMTDDSDRSIDFSAHPKAPELLKKSLQPMMARPQQDPSGVGASTQPKAPAQTTQQAKPPPSRDD